MHVHVYMIFVIMDETFFHSLNPLAVHYVDAHCFHMHQIISKFIYPWRMYEGYGSRFVCVSVS